MKKSHVAALMVAVFAGSICLSASAEGNWDQNHPRRHEVMHRDHHEANELNHDKGDLHGHYHQLMAEDRNIRHQEQRDAREHHGHITPGEQRQLNHEENHLQHQINQDQH